MKDCQYFQEQAMLKFFNEIYDLEYNTHLQKCADCSEFSKSLNDKFKAELNDSVKNDLERIKFSILSSSKNKKSKNYKLAIAAIIVFFTFISSYHFLTEKPDISNSNGESTVVSDTVPAINITTSLTGGETDYWSAVEIEIQSFEEQINLILEDDYHEKI